MDITRTSILTGITRTQTLPITPEQLADYQTGRAPIQYVLPWLTLDEREFLMTGIVQEEWLMPGDGEE